MSVNADTDEAVFVWYLQSRNGETMKIELGRALTKRFKLYSDVTGMCLQDAVAHALDDWMTVCGDADVEVITGCPMPLPVGESSGTSADLPTMRLTN
jgi:hypothetical protein